MTKTKKTAAKAKQNQPMILESEAVSVLQEFVMKTIMGNRKARRMVMNWMDSLPDDPESFDVLVKVLLTLVYQDRSSRDEYKQKFEGEDEPMELYHLAIDIRETLGYDVYDDTTDETEEATSARD